MRILCVKTHAFGDALLTTPAVAGLIDLGHQVSVLAGPSSLPVWERFPGLERVVCAPLPGGVVKLLRWSFGNRQKGYHRIIHFGSSPRVKQWLRIIAGSSVVSGADGATGFGLVKPAAADYCRIAGVECSDLTPLFPIKPIEVQFASELAGDQPYAVLAPAGARNPREFVPQKRWPLNRWAEVAADVSDRGIKVFLVGGLDDSDKLSHLPGLNLAGKLTWGQTAALMKGAAVFAGNDSGPAHLAVSTGVRALVLFGPTDPDSLYVKGSITAVQSSASCAPCYSNSIFSGCRGDGSCMESIQTETVLTTLEEMLKQ